MALQRIQKILAHAGLASRRQAENLIIDGLVTVNGRVAQLGDKAEMGKDAIKVKGKLLTSVESQVYLAFNKPKGVISMLADPEGRPTLASYLSKVKSRVYPIGRLDFNSDGLILLTNDGELAERLQKKPDLPRVYQVKVKGHPTPDMLDRIRKGGKQGRTWIRPHSVRMSQSLQSKALVEVVLMGSGGSDLKSLFEMKGFLIEKMTRTAIGHVTLKGLKPGEFRYLKKSQIQALIDQPELGLRMIERNLEEEGDLSIPRDKSSLDSEKEFQVEAHEKPRMSFRPRTGDREQDRNRGRDSDRRGSFDRRDERGPRRSENKSRFEKYSKFGRSRSEKDNSVPEDFNLDPRDPRNKKKSRFNSKSSGQRRSDRPSRKTRRR